MIRLIVTRSDSAGACNVGGVADTRSKTFDIANPELEQALRDEGIYISKSISFEVRDE